MGTKYGWHTFIQCCDAGTALLYSGITLSNGVLGIGYLFFFGAAFLAVFFLGGVDGRSIILR